MVRALSQAAKRRDIEALYLILLGREPEDDAVVEQRIGGDIIDICSGLMKSDEMSALATQILLEERLPHAVKLGGPCLKASAEWAKNFGLIPGDIVTRKVSWWLLLDALLSSIGLSPDTSSPHIAGLIKMTHSRATADLSLNQTLDQILAVDDDWFVRSNPSAAIALGNGSYETLEDYFTKEGLQRELPLLAACSTNLWASYRQLDGKASICLDDVVDVIVEGLQAGQISHWLFDSHFYLKRLYKTSLGRQDRRERPKSLMDRSPYLDFLTSGDAAHIPPHPLFSHYAYLTLNAFALAPGTSLFLDYLKRSQEHQARTSALFDPEYYITNNPDVNRKYLEQDNFNPLQHFLAEGADNNLRFSPDFDLDYYTASNPDARSAVASGGFRSITWHFLSNGLIEGRNPNPYFDVNYYRTRYPRCELELHNLGITSELEHFLLIGREKGYKAMPPLVDISPDLRTAKAVFMRRARRSWSSLVEQPLDFTSFLLDAPDISMIIPVCDGVEFTSHAVRSAYFAFSHMLQSEGLTAELIIVDNGSKDGTEKLFSTCAGIKILRFESRIGFPRAVNAGAGRASGRVLIICNNDIEFEPDVLLNVHRRLHDDRSAGLVGGLTILPNETLQEAGSFVECGGGAVGLGRGEAPWDVFFQGVHSADYCTGSLFGVWRQDFIALGGLDTNFSPGYYEESDLAFRMRSRLGKSSVVDSAIKLNHFEHASFLSGRPPAVAETMMQRNKAKFTAKHRQALAARPAVGELVTSVGPKPQAVGRRRILLIEDYIPDDRLGSGFPRTAAIMRRLTAKGVACDLLALHPNDVVDDFGDARTRVFRGWLPGQSAETVLKDEIGRYSHVVVCRAHSLMRFAETLERARLRHGVRIVCDTEAVSAVRIAERRRLAGDGREGPSLTEAVRAEFDAPVRIERWIAVTEHDKGLLEQAGFTPVSVIGHDNGQAAGADASSWATRNRLLTVGSIHETGAPNHDALLWFLDRVLPRCGEATRRLRLTAAGYWAPEICADIAKRAPELEQLGAVSEARLKALYAEARVALAPTRFAAGLPLKATEAMMSGVPIVVTDLVERQLVGSDTGTSGLAAGLRSDYGASFAAWVDRLADDPDAWMQVRDRQYEVAARHADGAVFDAAVEDLLEQLDIPSRASGR